MKKKVLLVITKSNWGGAQRYVFDLATNLPKEQFDVSVALGGDGELAKKLQESNITLYRSHSLQRDVSFVADLKSFFELYRLFKNVRPDVLHLNSSKAGGVGALAARLAGIKNIIFTVHGLPWDEPRNMLAKTWIYIATRLTFLLSHKVITISQDNYKRARACWLCRNKIHLIYNGIAPMTLGYGEVIRRRFPIDARITGTVGELTANKNHIALIEQARKNHAMYVAIVGEGELRPMLERKIREYEISDRVKLFGFLPAAEVLNGFDVFALPSLKEGFPYVLLEARMVGLPIDANRVGGVGEILDAKDMSEFSLERMIAQTVALY